MSVNNTTSVSTSKENMSSDSVTAKHNQVELKQCWRCGQQTVFSHYSA